MRTRKKEKPRLSYNLADINQEKQRQIQNVPTFGPVPWGEFF